MPDVKIINNTDCKLSCEKYGDIMVIECEDFKFEKVGNATVF